MLKIALLCGGPSLERGISLNSARSVCDHLQSGEIEILPIYFDHKRRPYRISCAQLYSNTPSDFDFKLRSEARPLSKAAFNRFLKTVNLAFPVMHGRFGEDGSIQKILETADCPYIGSPVNACKICFDKYEANEFIREKGFYTLPSIVLKSHLKDHSKLLADFFSKHKVKRAVVKPATGGSSIGVCSVSTVKEALEAARDLFSKRYDTRVVVEPFCQGTEFTVIILENQFDMPVAILPTEIEMDYGAHQVFDYRKKYLATNQVTYHCPPRFSDHVVEHIQIQAQQLFKLLGMRDFARFDGWLLPDGNLWFSDFNPISGMEQNSFLFQQASQIGMSHADLLRFIVKNACRRHKISFPGTQNAHRGGRTGGTQKKEIHVLFGGKTSERQVSLMSGTNTWLKLRRSKKYNPKPYLLDTDRNVWRIPYAMTLNHTVEEIMATCKNARQDEKRLHELKCQVIDQLKVDPSELSEPWFLPKKMTLQEFIRKSRHIFIGLHGGIGEDGTLQGRLEKAKVRFNGPGSLPSRFCMDKYTTAMVLKPLEDMGVFTASRKLVETKHFKSFKSLDYHRFWKKLTDEIGSRHIIVKPRADGCSAGIVRLFSAHDLERYMEYVFNGAPCIPQGVLKEQHGIIEMPAEPLKELMFEQFIITDRVRVVNDKLKWTTVSEWVEVTVGLVQEGKRMHAMNPSITVATGNVLTLEEKFQGGTGINITPPPQPYVKKSAIRKARERMEEVAGALGLNGYARIDAFMHVRTGELIIIEANSAPGLTPSTVIFHQALVENPPMYPIDFLEKIA